MTPLISSFLIILVAHWFADFVCQTHWQATNKSSNWLALTQHVYNYTCIITIPAAWVFLKTFDMFVAFLVITFLTHFVTDAITSRINTYLWKKGDVHNFFVSVGFDQLIHQFTLFGTCFWLIT